MRTLAIETATAACSVALFDDELLVDWRHEVVGRGHAERLLPMIAALADGGRADAILVDRGPGSFTGVRVGLAAARALGFGWNAPVQGFASLALIAAMADKPGACVVIEGGHGEVFVARYGGNPLGELVAPCSLPFAAALAVIDRTPVVGNIGVRIAAAGGRAVGSDIEPDARAVMRLPPSLRADHPSPFYGRAADAKPLAMVGA